MNFKEFLTNNPGAFTVNQSYFRPQEMPEVDLALPTQTVEGRVFKIKRSGSKMLIYVDRGTQWAMEADRYYRMGNKAPRIGDYIQVTFKHDNAVDSYNLVNRAV